MTLDDPGKRGFGALVRQVLKRLDRKDLIKGLDAEKQGLHPDDNWEAKDFEAVPVPEQAPDPWEEPDNRGQGIVADTSIEPEPNDLQTGPSNPLTETPDPPPPASTIEEDSPQSDSAPEGSGPEDADVTQVDLAGEPLAPLQQTMDLGDADAEPPDVAPEPMPPRPSVSPVQIDDGLTPLFPDNEPPSQPRLDMDPVPIRPPEIFEDADEQDFEPAVGVDANEALSLDLGDDLDADRDADADWLDDVEEPDEAAEQQDLLDALDLLENEAEVEPDELPSLSDPDGDDEWDEPEILDVDETATEDLWDIDDADPSVVLAHRKAANIVSLIEFHGRDRRSEAMMWFSDLFSRLPHHSTYHAIRRAVEVHGDLDHLVSAMNLRHCWAERSRWWLMRSRRGEVWEMPNGATALSWKAASRIVLHRQDHDPVRMIDDAWLHEWYELPRGSSGYFHFCQYAELRASQGDAELLHDGLWSMEHEGLLGEPAEGIDPRSTVVDDLTLNALRRPAYLQVGTRARPSVDSEEDT